MPDEPEDGPPPVAQWLVDELHASDAGEGPEQPAIDGADEAQPAAAGGDRPSFEAVPFPPDAPPPAAADAAAQPVPVPAPASVRLGCAVLELVLLVAGLGVGWLVWWVALWHRGGSPARSILHLELVADGGAPPGWQRTATRELPAKLLVPLAPISALVWLAGHRGLWDRVARTTVVRTPELVAPRHLKDPAGAERQAGPSDRPAGVVAPG